MKKYRILGIAFILVSLAGCATAPQSFVGEYNGPKAIIRDFSHGVSGGKAMACFVDEIDGVKVEVTSASATRGASMGTGFSINTRLASRDIKAIPLTLKLVATHMTGAPIHAIFSALSGQFLSTEKRVRFTPAVNGDYAVRCTLTPENKDVWIVDMSSNEPVQTSEVK